MALALRSSRATAVLEHAIYPTVVGGAAFAMLGAIGSGMSYWHVAPMVLALSAIVVVVLERGMPWSSSWRRDHGDTRTDVAHLVGNIAASHVSLALFAALLGAGARGPWPTELPLLVQFAIVALVMDLGLYAVHRASHHIGWLWRLHAIHHSAPRLYWVNGQRRHLVHEMLEGAPGIVVLGIAGAPVALIGGYIAVLAVHLMLQHGNIRYRAGILRYVFAVAELHRWHHQRLYAQTQGNYGALLSIWDRLFGTSLPERGDAPVDVGMDDEPDLPPGWLGQLVWPFRRRAIAPESIRSAASALSIVLLLFGAACATTLRPTGPQGELELRVGPVDLPASPAGHEHEHAKMTDVRGRYRVAQAGWITSFEPSMMHADGSPAPGKLLHHVALGAPRRSDFLCTKHPHEMPRLIMAAGGEQTPVMIPDGFGIPVDAGEKLVAFGMLANHLGEPHDDVSFAARMGFVARASGSLRPVVPVWIDVDEACPEDGYEVQPGEHVRRRTFRFPFAGTLRFAGGHMHDGGRLLRIVEKQSGRELVRYEPVYDDAGTIVSIPVFDGPEGLPIAADTEYVVESTYLNPSKHALRGMGLVVALVEPANPAAVR